jgi:peptidyl-prolyl cis-trans isomerase D
VQSGVVDSAFVAPYELDRRYAIERQEREVNYALVSANEFLNEVSITDEQIQTWYDEHQSAYLLPEKVDLQYVELTRARAESGVEVTEEGLREYYEQAKERFTSPERRKARHILITTEEGVDDAAALKMAEDLAAKATSGADFSELAKESSKDPGSAEQGGDLGWAQRGMFVGPFEEALFSMTPGEIRGPVKTQFGYHVLKLDEIEEGQIRSFEDVRAELESEYRAQRAQAVFYDESEKLGDLAFQSLTELESVAAAMDLAVKTVEDFTREGGGELGQDPNTIEAVFSADVLERGENSPLITLGEDRVLVVRVTEHTPATPRPLSEVRDQIEAQVRARAAREAAASKGADIVARLQKGESWEEIATSAGVAPVGKRFVNRQDSVAPPAVVQAAFDVPPTTVSETAPHQAGVVTDDGNYAVFEVTQVRNADPSTESADAKENRRNLAERRLGNEEFSGYIAEAERNAKIVKNVKVFE